MLWSQTIGFTRSTYEMMGLFSWWYVLARGLQLLFGGTLPMTILNIYGIIRLFIMLLGIGWSYFDERSFPLLGCWKAYLLGGKVWPLPACTVTVMEVNIVGVYLVHMPSTSIDEYSWLLPQAAFSMLYEGAAWMLPPQWLVVTIWRALSAMGSCWHKNRG